MGVEQLLEEAIRVRVPGEGSENRMEGMLRRRQRRALTWSMLAAAAVLLLSALVLHRIFIKAPDMSVRVAFTPGTAWSGEARGGKIERGDLLKVEFGVAEVVLPGGVRGVIEGPAEFRVDDSGVLELMEGRGWFRVEESGRGFLVRTPLAEIRDLGTEFGVVTHKNALDEVHVFAGRVEVRARYALKESRELVAGQAARLSPVGRWIDETPDDDGFLKKLPPRLPGIRFSFDGAEPLRPEGEHPAVEGMAVSMADGGEPPLVEGVRGSALSVRGLDDVVVTDWRGIGGDEPRTIACWIRYAGGPDGFAPIVSWGDGTQLRPGRCKLLLAHSPRHGDPVLRFSLGHNVNFSGSTPLTAGDWHHVAVVFHGQWNEFGDMVELYVDGEREKVDRAFSHPPREDQKIGTVIDGKNSVPLRIGTGPYRSKTELFLGEIDEVWILPRALSEREVRGLMSE